jgi:hypothetical protein
MEHAASISLALDAGSQSLHPACAARKRTARVPRSHRQGSCPSADPASERLQIADLAGRARREGSCARGGSARPPPGRSKGRRGARPCNHLTTRRRLRTSGIPDRG